VASNPTATRPAARGAAVITGGGSGIGRALCLEAAARGYDIAVLDIDLDAARVVAAEVERGGRAALAVGVDVTTRASVFDAAARVTDVIGVPALLCVNAGVGSPRPPVAVDALPEATWRWMLAVNVEGALHTVQAFAPAMKTAGAGRAVLITASGAAVVAPGAGGVVYAITKHALLALGDGLRAELADAGIGVTVLCPGLVNTEIWNSARVRPAEFGGPEVVPAEVAARWRTGMDADAVARRALDGVAAGAPYVFTHHETRAGLEARTAALLAAFDAAVAADPPPP
jgi:NAD(P)-dependent dehydrogenase (short-subunit alcohol dehydrogenase family)